MPISLINRLGLTLCDSDEHKTHVVCHATTDETTSQFRREYWKVKASYDRTNIYRSSE